MGEFGELDGGDDDMGEGISLVDGGNGVCQGRQGGDFHPGEDSGSYQYRPEETRMSYVLGFELVRED